jgi:L-asparaginase II
MTRFDSAFAPLVVADRSGLDESLHHGAGVALDAHGVVVASVGDPQTTVYPRSSLKPLQATAMVGLGLELPDHLLALVCASHNGEAIHLDGVRRILDLFDLGESDLDTTPSLPMGATARRVAKAVGDGPSSLYHSCSGKHAGMLATCRINGWPTDGYLAPNHPVQNAILSSIAQQVGEVSHVGVDGCGAPTHAVRLDRLAATFGSIAAADGPVARAMSGAPELVAGADRDTTALLRALPGAVIKDGAEGVMALGLPDGRAAALKVADGSYAARAVATRAALAALDIDPEGLGDDVRASTEVVVFGHGRPVGALRALEWQRR